MKNGTRRNLRGIFARAFKIVLAAGIILGYCYSFHLALDLKAKIDADEPNGEWFVQSKNEIRPRYIGPQNADALASAMRFDLGIEKSEAQTAKLKAHFERVLERGAVFKDNLDMLHFGPALMRRFKQAAEYERRRVAEHPEDAEYPTIRALYDLPESASWAELENALMDGDLKKWPDAKKRLDSMVDDAIKQEKKSTRETMRIALPISIACFLVASWVLTRYLIQTPRSDSRGIRLIKDKGIGKMALIFLILWCMCASSAGTLGGQSSAHNWLDNYTRMTSYLREMQDAQETARDLLRQTQDDNKIGYSDFDDTVAITEIQRHRGKYLTTNMLLSAAIFPFSLGMFAWLLTWLEIRSRALLAIREETDANKTEE